MDERISDSVRTAIDAACRAFGAPGDWGYGTREGDALLALHKARLDIAHPTPAEQVASKFREALEPFAEFARASSFDKLPDDLPMTQGSRFARRQITAGDFKRALAVMERNGGA